MVQRIQHDVCPRWHCLAKMVACVQDGAVCPAWRHVSKMALSVSKMGLCVQDGAVCPAWRHASKMTLSVRDGGVCPRWRRVSKMVLCVQHGGVYPRWWCVSNMAACVQDGSVCPRWLCASNMTGLRFEVVPSRFKEKLDKASFATPYGYAMETAKQKALEVANRMYQARGPCPSTLMTKDLRAPDVVIGADTIVTMGRLILEKPVDKQDAYRMLSQ
ncbi:hypothetical protein P7K49_037926 [Saguinus oedipus]|uniref:Uncharacterized protein n=1 Tax=Saguinus oedipus TaxID=9490 RepID=A0ABQ9TDQ8_SAGOE|nr:hypothetical protein P7K49_037926 [Saguinus oedipus]